MSPSDLLHNAATAKVPAFRPPVEEPLGPEEPTVVVLSLRRGPGPLPHVTQPCQRVGAARSTLAELTALTGLSTSVAQAEVLEREARRLEGQTPPGAPGPLRFFSLQVAPGWARARQADLRARHLFPVATLGDGVEPLLAVDFGLPGWPLWRFEAGRGLTRVSESWAEFVERLG
jgi:hypothetical protein